MTLFTVAQREQLRAVLVTAATNDSRIAAAAHLGSVVTGRLDRWSDIDLALGLAPDASLGEVMHDWTSLFYSDHGAVAHHDLRFGSTVYRVFLLKNTLQVDLSFWSGADFAAFGPAFQLIFGNAKQSGPLPSPAPGELIGMAWLYALHARSTIARGRLWQAEYMVSGLRDQALALACLRHGLSAHQGRGIDELPAKLACLFGACLVRSIETTELLRAFAAGVDALLKEIQFADESLAQRLAEPLMALLETGQ